jgi:hypothetical protein
MNKLFVIIGLTFVIALLGNRKGVYDTSASGEAIVRIGTFWKIENNIDTPYIIIPEKAWYQDSIGITQICGIFIVETDTNRITNITTMGYRFVDLKKKWAYEYATFTDTALVKRKYRYTDTTRFPGGWNFANRTPVATDSFHFLADTTIDAVGYKRCKVNYDFNQTRFEGIGLLRCDKNNTHFQIDTAISNKIGCSLVSFLTYPMKNPRSRFGSEIKFISDHLPDSVLRVFAAWKRNEKIDPVQ